MKDKKDSGRPKSGLDYTILMIKLAIDLSIS